MTSSMFNLELFHARVKASAPNPMELHGSDHLDLESGDSESSGSIQSDCWESTLTPAANASTTTNNNSNNIRSRVKSRSTSPNGSVVDEKDMDRLPYLHSDSSSSDSESEASGANSATTTSDPSSLINPGKTCILQWAKLLTLAGVLTTLVYLAPTITLEATFYPAHGRTFPGGLKSITSTPIFRYESPPELMPAPAQEQATTSTDEQRVHIPRIVHVTYKSREELPEEWKKSLQVWEEKHPDWEIRFWSDKDIEEFVHNEFPQYEALHKSYKYTIQRVDSVRYMILYHFGGLYSDMDIYPAASLDKLLQQWEDAGKNVLLAETSNMGVTNAFMASAKGSEFMGCVIENLPNYQHQLTHLIGWRHWEVLSSAGSTYLWGMVGHCEDDGVEILAARSFRGCSVCDAWETGKPAETCDTQWLRHSSTNSSWHQHGSGYHSFLVFFAYSFLCEPFRACFITVTLLLVLIHCRRNRKQKPTTPHHHYYYQRVDHVAK